MKTRITQSALVLSLSAALLSACSHQATQTQSQTSFASLTLVNEDSVFLPESQLIYWELSSAQTPVDIYRAASPSTASMTKIADDVTGNSYRLTDISDTRQYYYVQPEGSEGQWVAERLLPLEGGHNFRDLGGYKTENGRSVKWGRLYRSGTMVGLTEQDYEYLGALDIRVICDFRSREELAHEPTDWSSFAGDAQYLTGDYSMREMMSGDGALNFASIRSADDAKEVFAGFYRTGPYVLKEQYRKMFQELAAGNAPLAFNCSAGKDRTGMAAALVLTALGVPRDTVVADYALTEKVAHHDERPTQEEDQNAPHSGFTQMPAEIRAVFMGSDPIFIQAMFSELEKNHGSTMAYIQKELGVSQDDLARIRALYLTNQS